MAASRLPHHISAQFDNELEELRSKVLAMGGLVEEQLGNAIQAMIASDTELAEHVAGLDYRVNTMEVEIDEECATILARRQPTASDLRLVLAVSKTITDLERIGDEAERIGRMVMKLIVTEAPKSYYSGMQMLGDHVRRMLHEGLDTFARMDSEAAFKVAAEDQAVDREYEAILRQLITYMMEDPRSITEVMDAIWAVRSLERIGDHVINICEYVIYLVEGKDVRHTSLEEIEREIQTRE